MLTGPRRRIMAGTTGLVPAEPDPPAGTYGMVPARLRAHPLAATAALVWNDDLPRQLQQPVAGA